MRIVAGALRGRRLGAPRGTTTRPTTDRVREAVFSALVSVAGPDLGGGPVLDAFAGSGALGLEALSRGARPVTFIELDRRALSALAANVESLGTQGDCRVIRGDAFSLAKRGIAGGPFTLLLLDPPYTLDQSAVTEFLEGLAGTGALARPCHVVWEHSADTQPVWPSGFELLTDKPYGTTKVGLAVFEGGAGEK